MKTRIVFEQVQAAGAGWVLVEGWAAIRYWPSVPTRFGQRFQLKNDLDPRDAATVKATRMRMVDSVWCDDGSVKVRVEATHEHVEKPD